MEGTVFKGALADSVLAHLKVGSKIRSIAKANHFLAEKNLAGVYRGTFTAGLIQGKPQLICADYDVIVPTPTEFLDTGKLEEEGDEDDEEREGDADDVQMEDSAGD